MQEIESTVLDIIARKSGADRVSLTRETELSGLKLESIDILEAVFEIEEALNVSLMFNSMGANINTVGDVIDMVSSHINPVNASAPG